MKSTRFYREKVPDSDDVVMVKITKFDKEYGYTAELLEYDNIEGFAALSELVKGRRIKQHIFKIGEIVPLQTIGIDKNCVNLSKKRLNEDDIDKLKQKYDVCDHVTRFARELYTLYDKHETEEKMEMEQFMECIIWEKYDEEDLDYDQLMDHMLKDKLYLFDNNLSEKTQNVIFDNVQSRIIKKDLTYGLEFTLQVVDENAIYIIREIMKSIPIPVSMVSPPLYQMRLDCNDPEKGEEHLREIIHKIEEKFKELVTNDKSNKLTFSKPEILKKQKFTLRYLNEHEIGQMDE